MRRARLRAGFLMRATKPAFPCWCPASGSAHAPRRPRRGTPPPPATCRHRAAAPARNGRSGPRRAPTSRCRRRRAGRSRSGCSGSQSRCAVSDGLGGEPCTSRTWCSDISPGRSTSGTASRSSTSTAISWPRVSKLWRSNVSRCGIWSIVWLLGITPSRHCRMARRARPRPCTRRRDRAPNRSSPDARRQRTASRASLMKKSGVPAQDVGTEHSSIASRIAGWRIRSARNGNSRCAFVLHAPQAAAIRLERFQAAAQCARRARQDGGA